MDSVVKGLMGAMPLQNFWARTAPVPVICELVLFASYCL